MTDIVAAHAHSHLHRPEVEASEVAGCFYCLAIYPPAEIRNWIDDIRGDATGETAICPRCGIDSVIGAASGYPITPEFLTAMHGHWF